MNLILAHLSLRALCREVGQSRTSETVQFFLQNIEFSDSVLARDSLLDEHTFIKIILFKIKNIRNYCKTQEIVKRSKRVPYIQNSLGNTRKKCLACKNLQT